MEKLKKLFSKKDANLAFAFILLSLILIKIPTGFERSIDSRAKRYKGLVLSVDNSEMIQMGLIKTGDQYVKLKILNGDFKGKILDSTNHLMGMMDRDKIFAPGDKALVVISFDENNKPIFINPQEHYRIDLEISLFLIFITLLILFGGWTGVKAVLSFVFTALCIWKILVPCLLKGYDPIITTLWVTTLLCAAITFLVAGINKKGISAFAGSFLGVLTSCAMSLYFTEKFSINGAVMPFSETLLYSGFAHLDIKKIYCGAVFIASSGAVMDLAMDVAASMDEIKKQNKNISSASLIKSGINVGRAVTGTMTTTLLLAYSGGFITLLMAFMAQGIPLSNTFNIVYVSAEILKTLVGSFGLVTVAPFTAIVGGLVFTFDFNPLVKRFTKRKAA